MNPELLAKLAVLVKEDKEFDSLKVCLLCFIASASGPVVTNTGQGSEPIAGPPRGGQTVQGLPRGPGQKLTRVHATTLTIKPKAGSALARVSRRENEQLKLGKVVVPDS